MSIPVVLARYPWGVIWDEHTKTVPGNVCALLCAQNCRPLRAVEAAGSSWVWSYELVLPFLSHDIVEFVSQVLIFTGQLQSWGEQVVQDV